MGVVKFKNLRQKGKVFPTLPVSGKNPPSFRNAALKNKPLLEKRTLIKKCYGPTANLGPNYSILIRSLNNRVGDLQRRTGTQFHEKRRAFAIAFECVLSIRSGPVLNQILLHDLHCWRRYYFVVWPLPVLNLMIKVHDKKCVPTDAYLADFYQSYIYHIITSISRFLVRPQKLFQQWPSPTHAM